MLKPRYLKLILLLALSWGTGGTSLSQSFLPGLSDNYMGINQATLQPAAIVDSHFERDFNMMGFNCDIYNDAMRFRSKWLLNPISVLTKKKWWDENTYLDPANGKDKNFFMSQSILGPSFLLSIKEKDAIGFTFRLRSITNTDDLAEPLFNSVYGQYDDSRYWDQWYLDKDMRSVQHIFGDYGFLYARQIINKGPNFLKAGISVNLLQGINSAYVQSDSLYFYYDPDSGPTGHGISWNSANVYGGLSGNWGYYDNEGVFIYSMHYQFTSKPSVGLDFGLVYEFRPRYKQYFYNVNGKRYLVRKDKNKYLFRIGVSIVDIGRLKYKKMYNSFDLSAAFTPDYLQRYYSGDNSVPQNTYWLDVRKSSFSFLEYANFVDTLYHRSLEGRGVTRSTTDAGTFTMRLPTALSLQVDVKVYKRIYVNLTTYTGLNQTFSYVPNSHYISNYSITPRYEHPWFTLAVPVQYNQFGKVNVGFGGRIAFVYFGVNNMISAIFSDRNGLNIYFGVKLSVPKTKPRSGVDNDILGF